MEIRFMVYVVDTALNLIITIRNRKFIFQRSEPDHTVFFVKADANSLPGNLVPGSIIDDYPIVPGAFLPSRQTLFCIGTIGTEIRNFIPVAVVSRNFTGFVPHAARLLVIIGVTTGRPLSLFRPAV